MWWRIRRRDEDFADEIRAHLEHEIDRLIAEGMTREDARAAAHREFGSVTRTHERFHETRRIVWLEHAVRDLRYAWRGLWRSRVFAASTVLTLGVGIGLVTVVFAIFNAYVLRPFAVRDPYSLHAVGWQAQEAAGSTFRWRDYEEIQARHDLFDGVVAEVTSRALTSNGQQLAVGFVSGNYFDVLGPRVLLGRGLVRDDARTPGAEPVAVLTHHAWTRLFNRDPAALGREFEVNGRKIVVVGVIGAGFVGLDDVPRDIWMPLTMHGVVGDNLFGPDEPRLLRVTARLRDDMTPQQAQASLGLPPFETRVAGRVDAVRASLRLRATPARLTLEGLAILGPLFLAFGLVLLAACANASHVMLARANARHREIGIRLSLGASRGRVVRQLMTEGVLIAMLAGAAGLALAAVLLRIGTVLVVAMLPATIAARVRFVPLDLDHRVFLFAFMTAAAATIFFALLPALQATRLTLTDALRGQPGATIRSSTLRGVLVAGQIAVSLLLVVVASTLVRNGAALRAIDLGMETDRVLSVRQRQWNAGTIERAYAALTADSRVAELAVTSRNPLFGEAPKVPLPSPSGFVLASYRFVSPEYFVLLGMPIIRGREFTPEEARHEATVAIVSAAGANALWPGDDPIGKTMRISIEPASQRRVAETIHTLRRPGDGGVLVTVIGVTTDVVSGFVYEGVDRAHLYLPTSARGSRAAALMVRLLPGERPASAGQGSLDTLKALLQRANPDPLAFDVLALDEMVALQMFPLRAASWIGSLLSAVALALSISGIYGVLTYTFGQRTHEIGIRIALGASTSAVVRLVTLQSARVAGPGALLGLIIAFGVMKALSTIIRLENVSVFDPGAFAVSVALIAGAVALASYGPARRAARVDPSVMLRSDV